MKSITPLSDVKNTVPADPISQQNQSPKAPLAPVSAQDTFTAARAHSPAVPTPTPPSVLERIENGIGKAVDYVEQTGKSIITEVENAFNPPSTTPPSRSLLSRAEDAVEGAWNTVKHAEQSVVEGVENAINPHRNEPTQELK